MKSFSMSSISFFYVVFTLFFGLSICFHVGCNPVKLQKAGLNSISNPLSRNRSVLLYQDLKGGGKVDVGAIEKVGELKGTKTSSLNPKLVISAVISVVALAAAAASGSFGSFDFDFAGILERSLLRIESLGPYGYLYFALIYIAAEVLCVPAIPLAASSGYLFGLIPGFLTVLLSATTAACISFFIGRNFLRTWAQKIANGSEKWRVVDAAIGREGFKVILLLRITPLFPFSIVNYLYGLTSVNFWSYLAATLVGFTPGTLAIVYTGTAGKAVFSKGFGDYPWYVYVGAGALSLFLGKTVTKIASDTMKSIEADTSSPSPSRPDEGGPKQ